MLQCKAWTTLVQVKLQYIIMLTVPAMHMDANILMKITTGSYMYM